MTPDPQAVAEALNAQLSMSVVTVEDAALVRVLEDAARAWLEGTEIRWCERHDQAAETCSYHKHETLLELHTPCSIVPVRLVGLEKGQE